MNKPKIIRITQDVAEELARRRQKNETTNDVIRRALGWEPVGDRRRKSENADQVDSGGILGKDHPDDLDA